MQMPEGHLISKAVAWARHVFALGRRIATLEERVTALEEALETQPPRACPYCGQRAMRMLDQRGPLGDPGKQWMEDLWLCTNEACKKRYREAKKI
jgi:hypothetical protein